MSLSDRLHNIGVSLDQTIFCLLTLGKSMPDETASAAAYRTEQKGRLLGKIFRPIIDVLFFWQHEHCKTAFESELQRKQLPSEYQQ